MNLADMTDVLALIQGHKWIAIVALVAGAIARASKSDVRFMPNIPGRYRPILVFAVGALAAGAQMVASGASWQLAAQTALGGPVLAILGHTLGIHVMRDGEEIPVPAFAKSMKSISTSALVALLCLSSCGCAALAAAIPILSQADAIGHGVAKVLGWCDKNDVPTAAVAQAAKELADRQYLAALAAVEPALTARIQHGDVPTEIQATYQLAKGMAAAYAIEQGMRALSGRNPDGSARTADPTPAAPAAH